MPTTCPVWAKISSLLRPSSSSRMACEGLLPKTLQRFLTLIFGLDIGGLHGFGRRIGAAVLFGWTMCRHSARRWFSRLFVRWGALSRKSLHEMSVFQHLSCKGRVASPRGSCRLRRGWHLALTRTASISLCAPWPFTGWPSSHRQWFLPPDEP